VVPRGKALGWRKTHFGHPDGHIRQALGLGLWVDKRTGELEIPSAELCGRLRRCWIRVTCPEGQFWDTTYS